MQDGSTDRSNHQMGTNHEVNYSFFFELGELVDFCFYHCGEKEKPTQQISSEDNAAYCYAIVESSELQSRIKQQKTSRGQKKTGATQITFTALTTLS